MKDEIDERSPDQWKYRSKTLRSCFKVNLEMRLLTKNVANYDIMLMSNRRKSDGQLTEY